MGAITEEIPKPLVCVHNKPLLWYGVMTLHKHGFRNFILPLGYKGEQIEEYVQKELAVLGAHIVCVDTGENTSIAHRMLRVQHLIPEHADFFLLNSDTIFEFDIEAMYETHKSAQALVTLSSVEVVSSWGIILLRDSEIAGFDRERKVCRLVSRTTPDLEGVVNSGLAWLNKDALGMVDLQTCPDFETSVYQAAIQAGRAVHFALQGCWYPVDTPKDLQIVNMEVQDKHGMGHLTRRVKDALTSSSSHSQPQTNITP